MIRVVAVVSLVCLLVMVLYLPSAHPPERFLAQLRAEHQAASRLWGDEPAMRMLSRALSVQDTTRRASPVPSSTRKNWSSLWTSDPISSPGFRAMTTSWQCFAV